MMMTCLSFALMKSAIGDRRHLRSRRFCSVRYSIAKWMPFSSRPGTGRSRGAVAPPASTIASKSARSSSTGTLTPTLPFVRKMIPSSSCRSARRGRAHRFSSLNVGNAVAQQPADAIGALEHGDQVAGAIQLSGGRQTRPGPIRRRPRACPVAMRRRLGRDPAFVERAIDDRHLDGLDRDRVVVDAEHTRSLARRRTQASGEFREIVRRVQPIDGRPASDRGRRNRSSRGSDCRADSPVAERNAAVHAARRLILAARPPDTAGRPRASRARAR